MLILVYLLASRVAVAGEAPVPEAAEEAAAPAGPDGEEVAAEPLPAPEREAGSTFQPLQVAGVVTGGLGLVLLGVSGVFGVQATNLNEESKVAGLCDPDGNCTDAGLDKRNEAIEASQAATWTLLAGGVLTAAGATLFFVGGSKAGVGAEPVLSPSEAGMRLRGWF